MADITWVSGFLTPIVKFIFLAGFFGTFAYFVIKAGHNAWSKSLKFTFQYHLLRKPYPVETVQWCMDCIDQGIGWYDAKKLLMVKSVPQKQINETLWIYDHLIIELKGGSEKYGGKFKGISGKTERAKKGKLPNTNNSNS